MAKQKSTKKTNPRISNISKPRLMTTQEWQIKLRKQASEKEAFTIKYQNNNHYTIRNFNTSSTYHVVWNGCEHALNSCTCMDFKTSRLSTCKHLEAVKEYASKKKITPERTTSPCLFVDYSEEPRLRLYSADTPISESAAKYKNNIFDDKGFADPENPIFYTIRNFVQEMKKTCPEFGCTQDAAEFIDRIYDDLARKDRLNEIFKDEKWWKNYLCKDITPYPYQVEGMEFSALSGRCLIADEMGLGKTIQAIGTASLLYQEGFINSVLVVCPTSLKYQWQKEILKFCGKEALVVEGNTLQRRESYKDPKLFKIVSYNSLANDMKGLKKMSVDMIIMDEVQRLKNWNTQIAKGVRRIHADYKVILSGTPLENKLEELYSIIQLVDQYALGPYYEFREKHILTNDTGKIIGYKNLNAVGKALKPLLIRRRKADVALQLPERIDNNLFVPMTKEQMSIHEELKTNVARLIFKWKRMHYLSDTDRRRLLLNLSQMRMVCDSTFILDQESRHDTKVDEVINIIGDITCNPGNKVVVFSQWERMTRLIAMELDKRVIGYEYLHGGVPSVKRKQLMDNFNDNPDISVFISTDAGCTGLNLQSANYLINLDLPWNPAILEQRIGRIYRIGQRNNIQVINLVAMGTIEEQMLAKLKFKSSMFAGALDGGDDEVLLEGNKLQEIVDNFDFSQDSVNESPVLDEAPESAADNHDDIDETYDLAETPESAADTRDDLNESPTGDESQPYTIESHDNTDETLDSDKPVKATGNQQDKTTHTKDAATEVVQKGISFISDLVEVLSDPDSTKRMVDALVTEDKETGKTSINIPVKDKTTVMQFVSLIGKLLNQ